MVGDWPSVTSAAIMAGWIGPSERLERAFFEREVTDVAKDLLGRVIVSGEGPTGSPFG